jgi:hypothetical protein
MFTIATRCSNYTILHSCICASASSYRIVANTTVRVYIQMLPCFYYSADDKQPYCRTLFYLSRYPRIVLKFQSQCTSHNYRSCFHYLLPNQFVCSWTTTMWQKGMNTCNPLVYWIIFHYSFRAKTNHRDKRLSCFPSNGWFFESPAFDHMHLRSEFVV